MATVWSVLPPSTTINSSPGAKVTPLRVAERWSCSLRVGTITEMQGQADGVTPELALAIAWDIPRQQRHRINTVQKTLKGLTQRRQRTTAMADDVKMALQRHPLNRHDRHTASPQFIDEGNTRQNRHAD